MSSRSASAARAYAKRGWSVLPLAPGEKSPWRGFKWKEFSSSNPVTVGEVFGKRPEAGVGIRTGTISGIVVLDVDGAVGEAELYRLGNELGPLPTTLVAATGRGRHLYLAHAERLSSGPIAEGLDLKADGGYVAAPPSVHPSGAAYEWTNCGTEVAKLPKAWAEFLSDRKKQRDQRPNGDGTPYGKTALAGELERLRESQVGDRNNVLYSCACNLGELVAGGELGRDATARELAEAASEIGLDDREIESTIRSGMEKGRQKPRTAPMPAGSADRLFTKEGLLVEAAARLIEEQAPIRTGEDGLLYRYEGGVYKSRGDIYVRVALRELLRDRWRNNHINNVLEFLRAQLPTISRPPEDRVNVRNGLLDWRTGELHPHSPEFHSSVQLPVEWDPEAKCPTIEAFMREALATDSLALVLELFGYTLLPINTLQIAVLLRGPTATGKSTLLGLLRGLLGPAHVSAVTLQQLAEDRFAAADLVGKLANIVGDLDARDIKHTGLFKEVTGGDVLRAQRKYGQPFETRPFATLWFSANQPPRSADISEAYFRRWVVIAMDNQKPEQERDATLESKLRNELPGLLVQAVRGLRRLEERDWKLDLPKSVRRAAHKTRMEADPAHGFFTDHCKVVEDAWTTRRDLRRAYLKYCVENELRQLTDTQLYRRVEMQWPGRVESGKRRGERGFRGLRLHQED